MPKPFADRIPMQAGKPILEPGQRRKQPEFHLRYLECPDEVTFELIRGIVHLAPPVTIQHSAFDSELGFVLGLYRRATPGCEAIRRVTTILGKRSEVQPDLGLRISPALGGQSRSTDDEKYIVGAPEFVVEIADSSRSIDLHAKRKDYQEAGVIEYVVLCVEEGELRWWHFPSGEAIVPDRNGVAKSRVFPGLWLHVASVLGRHSARVEAVARQGLASRAHAAFVRRLAGRREGE